MTQEIFGDIPEEEKKEFTSLQNIAIAIIIIIIIAVIFWAIWVYSVKGKM